MIKKTLSLFLCLLLAGNVFAQPIAKDKIVVLDDFSGGLVTQLSPMSLSPKQADICENVRLNDELKSLVKRQRTLLYGTADATEAITGMHRLYLKDNTKILIVAHGDEIETGNDTTGTFTKILDIPTGNYRWQWTTWNNVAIGTDGYNYPVKYDGKSASATYLGTCLATGKSSGAGPNGIYTYKVTFYTTSYEVAFNVASNIVTVSNKDIDLSMIPIGPDTYGGETVTGGKIYRNVNGTSSYYLLSNGTIANNTAVTLTDSDADGELSATEYPTTYTCTPPKGKLCLVHYNRLFLANTPTTFPSRLYYSDDSNMDYFLPTDYYRDIRPDDGDQITFIKTFLGLLTVGKENTIQKVYTDGATPSTEWTTSDVFSNIGCKAMYSTQDSPIGIIYLGSEGLYKFNGNYSTLISEAITPEIKDILESNRENCWGQYHKNIYYLAYASKKTGINTNNRILLFDLVNNIFSIDVLNANCFASFNSGSDWDTLYFGSSANGKVYNYTFQAYEIYHNKHSDFTGNWTDCRYIPESVGGNPNAPVIEIARTQDIDNLTEMINGLTGVIDRGMMSGSYVSQGLNVGAQSYDKIYWNERFVSSGDDITVALRSATTSDSLPSAIWSSEFSDPSGSDLSSLTANVWMQYRLALTTDSYAHSPELYNYVKITYLKEASSSETSIPLHWRSGWMDFFPGYKKSLKKMQVYYDTEGKGTLNIKFSNYEGDNDTFAINLTDYPSIYDEYFTNGTFMGEKFRVDITEDSLYNLKIRGIILTMDIEPLE